MRMFNDNDEVLIISDDSEFKGHWGRVLRFEPIFERYFVVLPDVHPTGHFAFEEHELEFLGEMEEEYEAALDDDDPEEEEPADGITIEVPQFGMSAEEFAQHLEFMLGRALGRVGQVGPREAFFGFQEFEGLTPQEVLFGVLDKIEESMAMHAQLHILVARIGTALNQVRPEETK